jgi:hypothetical protein
MWDETPIDLFFAYDAFHDAAAAATRLRSLRRHDDLDPGTRAPRGVQGGVRPAEDWLDVDAMMEVDVALDTAEVLRWVGRIAGDADPRYDRIAAVLTRR